MSGAGAADPARPGARLTRDGLHFRVRAPDATGLTLCLFDGEAETRLPMARVSDSDFALQTDRRPGQRYGLRADGPWRPQDGLWFDPNKLLVDPYAVELDRRFAFDPRLCLPREAAVDTAALVPRAVAAALRDGPAAAPPIFRPGGVIYELNVRGFTLRHPDVPEAQRGTVAALAHPAVVAHLQKLRVSAVELMPVTAWIDEGHLAARGLRNAWGYNPVALMALDPGLCPGGAAELEATVAALREAGIGVILDLVFNHTGEGDRTGPILSLRGLDNRTAYASPPDAPGELVNDTGCGNTVDCHAPAVRTLVLDSLRHFASLGVDGFRFDLAPVLARGPDGFDPQAPIFSEIAADALLCDRVMIAEPWDVGPDGYRLGQFPQSWLEWNDRYRDDVRRFWRGDALPLGTMATRLAGSADVFRTAGERTTRSVSFLACHDGFTLADLLAYAERHNAPNGEDNRDGQSENYSWNGGAEGPTTDAVVLARRAVAVRAMLAGLFATRGTIMLGAGDECGRTQDGNNNAYAQDNATSWFDWAGRDVALEAYTAGLALLREALPALTAPAFLDLAADVAQARWLDLDGHPLTVEGWNHTDAAGLELRLRLADGRRVAVRIDRRASVCLTSVDTWC